MSRRKHLRVRRRALPPRSSSHSSSVPNGQPVPNGKPVPNGLSASELSAGELSELNLVEFPQICLDVAGIDIGSTEHYVSVPEDRDPNPVRTFGCFTSQINEMAQWLKDCHIRSVVMESTGVYWIPVFQVLESHGFNVFLADPRSVMNVPSRKKTDVHDCCWLRMMYSRGMLNPCFVPGQQLAEMRAYWRQHKSLVEEASRLIQLIHKSLEQMNIQIHKVLSDITGTTGMDILRAILNGERDPVALAQLKHPRVRSSKETMAMALTGNWRKEHLFTLKQAVAAYDFVRSQIDECGLQLRSCLEQYQDRTPPRDPDDSSPTDGSPIDGSPIDGSSGTPLGGTPTEPSHVESACVESPAKGLQRPLNASNEVSIFGLFTLTPRSQSSHVLAMPSTIAPHRLMLADAPWPHGSSAPPTADAA